MVYISFDTGGDTIYISRPSFPNLLFPLSLLWLYPSILLSSPVIYPHQPRNPSSMNQSSNPVLAKSDTSISHRSVSTGISLLNSTSSVVISAWVVAPVWCLVGAGVVSATTPWSSSVVAKVRERRFRDNWRGALFKTVDAVFACEGGESEQAFCVGEGMFD